MKHSIKAGKYVVIAPGIIQTSNEQIIHTTAAVIALANAKFNALIFIKLTSLTNKVNFKSFLNLLLIN